MDRRTFVASGAMAGVALSAGCLSSFGSGDGTSYSDWLYAPGAVEQRDHRDAMYVDTTVLVERSSTLGPYGTLLETALDDFLAGTGLTIEDAEWAAGGTGWVYGVDADPAAVREALDENGFDEEEFDGGYTLHETDQQEEPLSFGIGEGYVLSSGGGRVFGNDASRGPGVVEAMVDAETGGVDRYQEANEDFGAALDAVEPGLYVGVQSVDERETTNLEEGAFEGVVADGIQAEVTDTDEGRLKTVYVFDDADDVDLDAVEAFVAEHLRDGELADVSVQQDGRVVTGTGTGNVRVLI